MLSLFEIPLSIIAVVFTRGKMVPFQPLLKNSGEKPAFHKGDFSAIFSPVFKDSASGLEPSLGLVTCVKLCSYVYVAP
jgi:hypothetical protein